MGLTIGPMAAHNIQCPYFITYANSKPTNTNSCRHPPPCFWNTPLLAARSSSCPVASTLVPCLGLACRLLSIPRSFNQLPYPTDYNSATEVNLVMALTALLPQLVAWLRLVHMHSPLSLIPFAHLPHAILPEFRGTHPTFTFGPLE